MHYLVYPFWESVIRNLSMFRKYSFQLMIWIPTMSNHFDTALGIRLLFLFYSYFWVFWREVIRYFRSVWTAKRHCIHFTGNSPNLVQVWCPCPILFLCVYISKNFLVMVFCKHANMHVHEQFLEFKIVIPNTSK